MRLHLSPPDWRRFPCGHMHGGDLRQRLHAIARLQLQQQDTAAVLVEAQQGACCIIHAAVAAAAAAARHTQLQRARLQLRWASDTLTPVYAPCVPAARNAASWLSRPIPCSGWQATAVHYCAVGQPCSAAAGTSLLSWLLPLLACTSSCMAAAGAPRRGRQLQAAFHVSTARAHCSCSCS
eukprot:SAG11_NODE_147_length_14771_cov_3.279648_5_plen_180_part_00